MGAALLIFALSSGVAADCREGSCYWEAQPTWPVDDPSDALCTGLDGTLTMGDVVEDGSLFSELALEFIAARQNQTCAAWDGATEPIADGLTSYFDPRDPDAVVVDGSGRVATLKDKSGRLRRTRSGSWRRSRRRKSCCRRRTLRRR